MKTKIALFSFFLILSVIIFSFSIEKEPDDKDRFYIMAYYAGNDKAIDDYDVSGLTHIIFSFCHLEGNKMVIPENRVSTVKKLVTLKDENPDMKVLLALGGWGGCETCSVVFSKPEAITEFAWSVNELLDTYNADGIDLDWEYPGISGYPGHPYKKEDKQNFSLLVENLRKVLGNKYHIGFAAGGSPRFFDNSVEWHKVMPLVDYVNIMTYDLVSGGPVTGHHTPLYSTPGQTLSAGFAVNYLDSLGVDRSKMVIGAAFYGRTWENVKNSDNGLFQPATFKSAVTYRELDSWLAENKMVEFWDEIAQAPYAFSTQTNMFATYDNDRSVKLKTRYALDEGLGGIMFWQLAGDKPAGGLLHSIYRETE